MQLLELPEAMQDASQPWMFRPCPPQASQTPGGYNVLVSIKENVYEK